MDKNHLTKKHAIEQKAIVRNILNKYQELTYPCRIAKYMAYAGVDSRRKAETMVTDGLVKINSQSITDLATKVEQGDLVSVDGKVIKLQGTRLFLYHKPFLTLTSNVGAQNKKTIFEHFPKEMPHVVTIGRLDYNTSGLLLLTTSGEIARAMELPSTGCIRTYKCRIFGHVKQEYIDRLKSGITVDGEHYKSIILKALAPNSFAKNQWYTVSLKEGKNREIRKALSYFGLQVSKLVRIGYGPFSLGQLPSGAIAEVNLSQYK